MVRPAFVVAGVVSVASLSSGGAIYDAGFFDSIPTTVIDFETDGSGGAVGLANAGLAGMPAGEYAGLGVTFSPAVNWVNDGGASFDAAQTLAGSPEIAISYDDGDGPETFSILFSVPVRSVGLVVIDNNSDLFGDPPVFTAYDNGDNPLGMVTFSGVAVDGTVGSADYGFLGLCADVDIARLEITKDAAIFDDLTFSSMPSPGALGLFGLAGLGVARRRR